MKIQEFKQSALAQAKALELASKEMTEDISFFYIEGNESNSFFRLAAVGLETDEIHIFIVSFKRGYAEKEDTEKVLSTKFAFVERLVKHLPAWV